MIKNMSGFVDPYSLGFIISIFGAMVTLSAPESAPTGVNSSQQYEEILNPIQQQGDPSLNPQINADLSAPDK